MDAKTERAASDPKPKGFRAPPAGRWPFVLGLAAVLALAALLRVRLLDVPLERDEGEYAYAGQLLLDGIPPFARAYNMKFPGAYVAYAASMAVFGETAAGIRFGLLAVNGASILLLYAAAARLLGRAAGLAAAGAFAVLSFSHTVQGAFAHAEHYVVVCALGGTVLLLRAIDSARLRTLFLSGVCFGLACLMKQQGAAFALFGGLVLAAHERFRPAFAWKRTLCRASVYAAGVVLPIAAMVLWLLAAGVFDRFRFWTFEYAGGYVSAVPLAHGLESLELHGIPILSASPVLVGLAILGVSACLWDRQTRSRAGFILGFLILSFAAASLGLYFRPHYFVHVLPAAALAAGAGASALARQAARLCGSAAAPGGGGGRALGSGAGAAVLAAVLAAGVGQAIYSHRDYAFVMAPDEVSRSVYGANPFPESVAIGRYIRENSNPGDTIAVLGSEPQIYFYARRRAATGYIYMYALMEDKEHALPMQKEMISQIEAARPEYLVYVDIYTSWGRTSESPELIFDWSFEYCRDRYEQVAGVNILFPEPTRYDWSRRLEPARAEGGYWIGVFRRRPGW